MINLEIGNLSKEEVYTLMKGKFFGCKIGTWQKSSNVFNHNTSYDGALPIIKNGILSYDERYKRGLLKEKRLVVNDINGSEYISVSKEEFDEYNPYGDNFYYEYNQPDFVNFVIDEDIRKIKPVLRNRHHYSNEYLIPDSISLEYIKCVEFRFLKLLKTLSKDNKRELDEFYNYVIEHYNKFLECVKYMVENNVSLPIIEASEEEMILDKEKILKIGKIVK